jgi:hypothetical protein
MGNDGESGMLFRKWLEPLEFLPDGGKQDRGDGTNQFKAPVRIRGHSDQILGSGVAIAKRWVLTASHLFAGRPKKIWVDQGDRSKSAVVTRIVWWSGAEWPRSDGTWPPGIDARVGRAEELVLLELSDELFPDGTYAFAPEPGELPLQKMQDLALAGFGVDVAGNYSTKVRVVLMRSVAEPEYSWGAAVANLREKEGGLPRRDDSGAPLFHDKPQKPRQVVMGVHIARTHAVNCRKLQVELDAMEVVSKFLVVGSEEAIWIDRIVNHKPSVKKELSIPDFVLRENFECHSLDSLFDFCGPGRRRWKLTAVHSTKGIIHSCDEVWFDCTHEGPVLRIHRCGKPDPVHKVLLHPGKTDFEPKGILWLTGKDSEGTEFCVFRRKPCLVEPTRPGDPPLDRSRIRIEVFVRTSTHARPSIHNIRAWTQADSKTEEPLPQCDCAADHVPGFMRSSDDQDDEGEGYED